MKTILVTPATFKPLEVEYVKIRPEMRVSGAADDGVILDLIEAAALAYEHHTGNVLCRSAWDLVLDAFPAEDGAIETPAPLASVTSVKYFDAAGAEQTLAAAACVVDGSSPIAGRIGSAYGYDWPETCARIGAVTVRASLGYANQASIPAAVRQGLMLKIQELYYGTDTSDAYEDCWNAYRRIAFA